MGKIAYLIIIIILKTSYTGMSKNQFVQNDSDTIVLKGIIAIEDFIYNKNKYFGFDFDGYDQVFRYLPEFYTLSTIKGLKKNQIDTMMNFGNSSILDTIIEKRFSNLDSGFLYNILYDSSRYPSNFKEHDIFNVYNKNVKKNLYFRFLLIKGEFVLVKEPPIYYFVPTFRKKKFGRGYNFYMLPRKLNSYILISAKNIEIPSIQEVEKWK